MAEMALTFYGGFSPVGDFLVLAVCLVFIILFHTAYINRTLNFVIFRTSIYLLLFTAIMDIHYHMSIMLLPTVPDIMVYSLRIIVHFLLFSILTCYVFYIRETFNVKGGLSNIYIYAAFIALFLIPVLDLVISLTSGELTIRENGTVVNGITIFPMGYIFFVVLIFVMIINNRSRIYKQVLLGACFSTLVSIFIMIIQGILDTSSFTVASFLMPSIAILYLAHSTPYDLESGAVNITAFNDYVTNCYRQNKEILVMSLYLKAFDVKGKKFSEELQTLIRYYNHHFFKSALLFQISGGHIILVAETAKNPDYEERLKKMYENFKLQHERFQLDHKIVFLKSTEEIGKSNDYIALIQYLENHMNDQDLKYVDENDFKAYEKHKYILSQLEDISSTHDLNDPRIEVFCQPVLNTATGKFDTAEALMRLRLEETGMVFPDQFIPIAEKYGYIHALSFIILNKTCMEIRSLMREGYVLKRISVNFSMLDVRLTNFCDSIRRIISDCGIPFDKIAIELTESQNEKEFLIVKEKINELKQSGIKFYLDDYGTGYSNFDRIIALPFDIIKFDRSLVIASGKEAKSETMVSYLAHMFSDMNYSVLYEGIEDDRDEIMCRNMCGRYLQGYKYSKPIPIAELRNYFERA